MCRSGPDRSLALNMFETKVARENLEATEAWNGPLFDIWHDFQAVVVSNARAHGDAALVDHHPEPGDRVLDIGCGLGDSTVQLAALVGRERHAHGVDVAERMIAGAQEDAARARVENVSFEVADVQVAEFADTYDYAFARFGTMFFANPVAALRNVRHALRPGGRLNIVVWRRKLDNEWLHRAETIVEGFLERPEEYDEPTCGPGPFSMANADTVTDVLTHAGFEDLELKRQDLLIKTGDDLEHAVDLVMSIGPAGEVLRLWGDRAVEIRPKVRAALLEGMTDMVRDDAAVYARVLNLVRTRPRSGIAPSGPDERAFWTSRPARPTAAAWRRSRSRLHPADDESAVSGPIALFDAESGRRLRDLTAGADSSPPFSPDGRTIAFVRGRDLYTVPVRGGRARRLARGVVSPAWAQR